MHVFWNSAFCWNSESFFENRKKTPSNTNAYKAQSKQLCDREEHVHTHLPFWPALKTAKRQGVKTTLNKIFATLMRSAVKENMGPWNIVPENGTRAKHLWSFVGKQQVLSDPLWVYCLPSWLRGYYSQYIVIWNISKPSLQTKSW